MKERNLAVSDDMLLAIIKEVKTRSSRVVVKNHPKYYNAGDRLWLSYTWATHKMNDDHSPKEAHDYWGLIPPLWIKAIHTEDDPNRGRWRTPRFLPRAFAQMFCKIVDSKSILLHDLTEEEICEEGMDFLIDKYGDGDIRSALLNMFNWNHPSCKWAQNAKHRIAYEGCTRHTLFSVLWDKLNYRRGYGWESNPRVTTIKYKVLHVLKPVENDLQLDLELPALDNQKPQKWPQDSAYGRQETR